MAFYLGSDSRAASLTDFTFTGDGSAERLLGTKHGSQPNHARLLSRASVV